MMNSCYDSIYLDTYLGRTTSCSYYSIASYFIKLVEQLLYIINTINTILLYKIYSNKSLINLVFGCSLLVRTQGSYLFYESLDEKCQKSVWNLAWGMLWYYYFTCSQNSKALKKYITGTKICYPWYILKMFSSLVPMLAVIATAFVTYTEDPDTFSCSKAGLGHG